MTTHAAAALMTAASLEDLRFELGRLRRTTGDHATCEEQMILEARIAALEDTIDRAVVIDVDPADPDVAVIGSTVTIQDVDSDTRRRYRLASAHQELGPDLISAASPMGQALMGARRGDVLTVDLPNGSSRSVRLVSVEGPASR